MEKTGSKTTETAQKWVRLWGGMTSDPKFKLVSKLSGRPLSEVVSVFVHLMLEANEGRPRGDISHVKPIYIDALFDLPTGASEAIIKAMEEHLIKDLRLSGWNERQVVREDGVQAKSSSDRVREYRQRKEKSRQQKDDEGVNEECIDRDDETQCNAMKRNETQRNAPEENRGEYKNLKNHSNNHRHSVNSEQTCAQQPYCDDDELPPGVSRAIELTAMLRKRGAAVQASNPVIAGWVATGITDAQILTALDLAEEARQAKADPSPINAGYLDSILKNRVLSAKAAGPPRGSRKETAAERYRRQMDEMKNGGQDERAIEAEFRRSD